MACALIVLVLVRCIAAYRSAVDAEPAEVRAIHGTDKKLLVLAVVVFIVAVVGIVMMR